jgi:hypothetical protein
MIQIIQTALKFINFLNNLNKTGNKIQKQKFLSSKINKIKIYK